MSFEGFSGCISWYSDVITDQSFLAADRCRFLHTTLHKNVGDFFMRGLDHICAWWSVFRAIMSEYCYIDMTMGRTGHEDIRQVVAKG